MDTRSTDPTLPDPTGRDWPKRAYQRAAKRGLRASLRPRRIKGGRHAVLVFRDAVVNGQLRDPAAED